MTKHMLIDATHAEETRVVVMNGKRIDDYDVETSSRRQLKGNIYLAKVMRIEPSLQAAFVDYGGNRHGFLAFSEIHPDYFQIPVADREKLIALQEEEYIIEQRSQRSHENTHHTDAELNDSHDDSHAASYNHEEPDHHPEIVSGEHDTGDEHATARQTARFLRNYRIQEVIRRRQIILVQVVKEERGNKGAALTTYISLAGRYCVLMPNALRGGGVSRKITSDTDRKRLRDIINQLDLPRSMAMIIRTAGAGRPGPEIVRDCDYLLQLWDDIRSQALNSIAPTLVYEEASLIKRAIRDLFTRDIEDIIIDGEQAWKHAREFTRQLMPHNTSKIKAWQNRGHSLFSHYNVENHLDAMFSPTVRLESGGYLVINQTEALVSIDVNSGKSTSQRNIEETALRTNLEAAEEVARQLRLRDLAGLIVIDFIDMESNRHNAKVEKRLKEALRLDRARIQIGRISHFGLLEMSRQRLRPSFAETMLSPCPHCQGTGTVRGVESTALHVLRAIEEEAARHRNTEITANIASGIVLYMLNHKRDSLTEIEARHQVKLFFQNDDTLTGASVKLERPQKAQAHHQHEPDIPTETTIRKIEIIEEATSPEVPPETETVPSSEDGDDTTRRRRRRNRRRGQNHEPSAPPAPEEHYSSFPEQPEQETEHNNELMPGRRRTRLRRKTTEHEVTLPPNTTKDHNAVQPYEGPTPANPFAGLNIFDVIEQEACSNTNIIVEPEQPVAEKTEVTPTKTRRRSRKATTSTALAIDNDETTKTDSDKQPEAQKEKATQPVRKRRTTPRKKATVTEADSVPGNSPDTIENSAVPQPINVDDTKPTKQRIGWWKR